MNRNKVFDLNDLTDVNFKTIQGKVYVSDRYLISKGINKRTLANTLSKYKKSIYYSFFKDEISGTKWLRFESLPLRFVRRLDIPEEEEVLKKEMEKHTHIKKNYKNLQYINMVLENAWTNPSYWKQFTPYYTDYYLDRDTRILFAKTHSIFNEIISLKNNYKISDIHLIYLKFDSVVFRTENTKYFGQKILLAKRKGIAETLLHDFKKFGRNPYKLSDMVQKRLIFFYSVPKRYSMKQVYVKVNEELIVKGLAPISYSSVSKFLSRPDIQNRCSSLRYGKKYCSDNLLPFLKRRQPTYLGEVIMVDASVLNLPTLNENKEVFRLTLCVVIDVFSKKVIGHSFSISENNETILEAIKNAFENFKIIPKEILVDNHKAYYSKEFETFKTKIEEYGVHIRSSRIENAKDKGQIERWFYTFQSSYLNEVIGSFGNGITARKRGSRIHRELEKLYLKKDYIRDEELTKKLIGYLIEVYNSKIEKSKTQKDISKVKTKKFKPADIAKIFFKCEYRKVRNSMIFIKKSGQEYSYTVRNTYLANRINNTKVKIRYDPGNMAEIFVYEDATDIYLCDLKVDYLVNIVATENDLKVIKTHNEMIRSRITTTIKNLLDDFEEGKAELKSLPTQVFNSEKILKQILNQAEDELLIAEMIPSSIKSRIKKEEETDGRIKDTSRKYIKRKRKIEIVKKHHEL